MNGREVILGISGGIAAYKAAELTSKLVQRGTAVTVVMTRAATKFVGKATFEALSGRPVAMPVFEGTAYPLGAHVELAARAEVLCVAPATADFLARTALGLADDLLTTLYLSFSGRIIMAPAMNCAMWEKPSVQRNVAQLRGDGVKMVGPDDGWLSCRQQGTGRMASPDSILDAIFSELEIHAPGRAED